LVVGGSAYEELRAQERSILSSAILGVRARRLATPDFTWADHIPQLTRSSSTARADDRVVERLLQQHAAVAESG
jgi:hypothetical protein